MPESLQEHITAAVHDAVQQGHPADLDRIIARLMPVVDDLTGAAFDNGYMHGVREARKLKAQASAATWPSRASRLLAEDARP